eukprot:scaffold13431_cov126-Isochrysis_galbana.AAC.1
MPGTGRLADLLRLFKRRLEMSFCGQNRRRSFLFPTCSVQQLPRAASAMTVAGWEHLSPSEIYRRRFESSVLGQHPLFPPTATGKKEFSDSCFFERPKGYPSGPNTSFADPTPMPFRFQESSLAQHNQRYATHKKQHPCFETSSADVGKLPLSSTDFHMRWYGLEGRFTNQFYLGGARPGQKVGTGLSTAMDRSSVHHAMDQGWSGKLGLKDYNIGSLHMARSIARDNMRK